MYIHTMFSAHACQLNYSLLIFAIHFHIRYNFHMSQHLSQLIGVYGFILNNNNELLIVQRAAHDSYPGMWEMPGGGLDYGESPKEGIEREVFEETGLKVLVLYPLSVTSGFSSKKNHIIRIAHLCELKNEKQQVQLSTEHSNFKWVDLNYMLENDMKNISKFLREVLAELKEHPHLLESA